MINEWYDVHHISCNKVIVSGQTSEDEQVEVLLSEEQRRFLENFEMSQSTARTRFLKDLIS